MLIKIYDKLDDLRLSKLSEEKQEKEEEDASQRGPWASLLEEDTDDYDSDDSEEEGWYVREFKYNGITYFKNDGDANVYVLRNSKLKLSAENIKLVGVWDVNQSKVILDKSKRLCILNMSTGVAEPFVAGEDHRTINVPEYIISLNGEEPETVKLSRSWQSEFTTKVAMVLEALGIINNFTIPKNIADIKNGRYQLHRINENEWESGYGNNTVLIDTDTQKVYDLYNGKEIGHILFTSYDEPCNERSNKYTNLYSKNVRSHVDTSAGEKTGKMSLEMFVERHKKILRDNKLSHITNLEHMLSHINTVGLNVGVTQQEYNGDDDLRNACDKLDRDLRMINFKKWSEEAQNLFKSIIKNKRHPYYWYQACFDINT